MAIGPDSVKVVETPKVAAGIDSRTRAIIASRFIFGVIVTIGIQSLLPDTPSVTLRAQQEAGAKFSAQPTPTILPELAGIARQLDDLHSARQRVSSQTSHIPSSLDGGNGYLLYEAWLQDRNRQTGEIDDQITAFIQSPQYREVVGRTMRQRQEFAAQAAANNKAYLQETERLKKEAGVNWFTTLAQSLTIPIGMGLMFLGSYVPIMLGRPSWPFRESRPQTPTAPTPIS